MKASINMIARLTMILIFAFLLPVFSSSVRAATLKFDPLSAHKEVGEAFEIKVIVDTDTKKILGVDAIISYDPNVLEVVGINDGTFLKVIHKEFGTAGRVNLGAVVEDPASDKDGKDVIASIVFKAKADGGTDIKYICDLGETNESNIAESSIDANDIIECAQNDKSTITVGKGVAPTSSQTPPGKGDGTGGATASGTTVKTASPTGLLKGGSFENLMGVVFIGILFLGLWWGIKHFVL